MGAALSRASDDPMACEPCEPSGDSSDRDEAPREQVGSKRHACDAVPDGDDAQTIAVRKLQRLLDALRPTRADCEWTAAEQLHLVLFAWLKDKYPLDGVIAEQKIGKAQKRVNKLLELEVVRDLLDELKVSSDSEVTRNLMDLAPKLRTPEGRGEVVSSFEAKMEEDRSTVMEDEETMSEDGHLALPCGTAVVLHSLHDAEFNQLPGCIREYDPARARYKVAVKGPPSRAPATDGESTHVYARRENMVVVEAATEEAWLSASVAHAYSAQVKELERIHGEARVRELRSASRPLATAGDASGTSAGDASGEGRYTP